MMLKQFTSCINYHLPSLTDGEPTDIFRGVGGGYCDLSVNIC